MTTSSNKPAHHEEFSVQDLRIINNALNEVVNAIELPEFETRMGCSVKAAEAVLAKVSSELKKRNPPK